MGFRDKITSGVTVLAIGLALLIFTFVSAYLFLNESLQIVSSQDLVQTFGDALAPLIATCIRVMYLGVMGWIGSIVTIRGVTIMSNTAKASLPASQGLQMSQMAKNRVSQQRAVSSVEEAEEWQMPNKGESAASKPM